MRGTSTPGTAPVTVSERLEITGVSPEQAARAGRPPEDWTADDFAAYVTEEISRHCGPQLPCRGARDILDGFWARHGAAEAVRVVRAAFEVYGGLWAGAPVTVRRFAESSDEFFARVILERVTT